MGEMADEIYDQIMDSEWGFFRPRSSPQCYWCKLYLRWHKHPVGWRLTNPDNTVHDCRVASIDEFGIVE